MRVVGQRGKDRSAVAQAQAVEPLARYSLVAILTAAFKTYEEELAMKIVRAERIPLNLPFYHRRVTRAMHRASTHGERVWVVRLEADNGLGGWGDDLGWDEYWDFGGAPPPRRTRRPRRWCRTGTPA